MQGAAFFVPQNHVCRTRSAWGEEVEVGIGIDEHPLQRLLAIEVREHDEVNVLCRAISTQPAMDAQVKYEVHKH